MKLLVAIAILSFAHAQSVFEVASVKPGKLTGGSRGGCHGVDSIYTSTEAASAPPLGRCVIHDSRLSHLIFFAYKLRSMSMLKAGPDWVASGDDRYDVEAKAENPKATEAELLQMLQNLLNERFHLKFHRETHDMQGFELLLAKNGPKLKESKAEEARFSISPSGKPIPGQLNTLTAQKYSMTQLADLLAQFGPPVLDKTGLTGDYDFTISGDDTNGPVLSTALQQQLGLKFEAEKVPVSFFVVESAQKPTAN